MPDYWEEYLEQIPEAERGDMMRTLCVCVCVCVCTCVCTCVCACVWLGESKRRRLRFLHC